HVPSEEGLQSTASVTQHTTASSQQPTSRRQSCAASAEHVTSDALWSILYPNARKNWAVVFRAAEGTMRPRFSKHALTALIIVTLLTMLSGQQSSPQLVLYNGKIFTSDAKHPYAEALAIQDDHILAVGSTSEILRLADNHSRRIDLVGRTV